MSNCPICKKYFDKKKLVLAHMEKKHYEQIPDNMSTGKYYYALNHNGETNGVCKVCSSPTDYDEATGRVKILCNNPKCKTAFSEMIQKRSIDKLGVAFVLQNRDTEHQMQMLANRKISGVYDWSDGKTHINYVGSYERRFLEFLDIFLDFDPSVIHAPCPIVINYEYEGETLQYYPDYYIDILNLIVEIKHGGANPNNHPKIQMVDVAKDKAKEAAIKKNTQYNYIKIVDNDFKPLMLFLSNLKDQQVSGTGSKRLVMINEAATDNDTSYIEPTDLYFIVYGDPITLDMNVVVSLSFPFTKFISYNTETQTFEYNSNINKFLKDYDYAIYKYVDTRNSLHLSTKKLVNYVNENTEVPALCAFNAFASIYSEIFDKANNYNVSDYVFNTYLSKFNHQLNCDGIDDRTRLIDIFAEELAILQKKADKYFYIDNNKEMSSYVLDRIVPIKTLAAKLGILDDVYNRAYEIYDFRNSGKDGYIPEWVKAELNKEESKNGKEGINEN